MRGRSGSWAPTETASSVERWEQEWTAADATDRLEATPELRQRTQARVLVVALPAALGALLAAIFPFTPGFSPAQTGAATVAAAVTAAGAGDLLVFVAALGSAGAAAIHLAVAKMHFDEYTLFGLFFVGSGIAQFVWPIWLLFRRWPPLLVLGAAGNALIVALWGVDRIWGLPLGRRRGSPTRSASATA